MVFSIFKKGRKSGSDSLIDADSMPRDDIVQPNARPGSPGETRDQVRKRQAEMTAKIDQIEQEMRGEFPTITRPTMPRKPTPVPQGVQVPNEAQREPDPHLTAKTSESPPTLPPLDMSTGGLLGNAVSVDAIDVSESAPGLSAAVEEAAVLYANGQSTECVKALKDAITSDAANREAWLLLFEVHQQNGAFREFEALAMDYSVRFESSPPAWRTMQAAAKSGAGRAPDAPVVALPRMLDAQVSSEIEQFRRHAKLDRVRLAFDAVREFEDAGAQSVVALLRDIAKASQQVTVTGVDVAFACARNVLVAGDRSQPESLWLLAMELLRLLRREQDYDDLSVEYTVTFEVSPPQYEALGAHVVVGAQAPGALLEAKQAAQADGRIPLAGAVTGKASEALAQLEAAMASGGTHLEIDCAHLSRVDFAGAGSLLNWLMSAKARGRHCVFVNVNPLVAALFGVMGVNGVAEVVTRRG